MNPLGILDHYSHSSSYSGPSHPNKAKTVHNHCAGEQEVLQTILLERVKEEKVSE